MQNVTNYISEYSVIEENVWRLAFHSVSENISIRNFNAGIRNLFVFNRLSAPQRDDLNIKIPNCKI